MPIEPSSRFRLRSSRLLFVCAALGGLLMALLMTPLMTGVTGAAPPAQSQKQADLAAGADARIVSQLESYFAVEGEGTESRAERREIARKIEADPGYDPGKVRDWLHEMDLYEAKKPGVYQEVIPVGFNHGRRLTIRIPKGYDPARAWPVVFAFHPSGGTGPAFLGRAERLLGKRLEEFIIVAPTHYRQTVFDAPGPFTPEHPVMVRWLREYVHVDSDRVYVLGSSLGGYTAWTLSGLHPDLYAGAVALASTYSAPVDVEGLWEAFLPNHANLPVLHVWGERDSMHVPGFDGRVHSGSMSELNRRLRPLIRELGLGNIIDRSIPGAGHGGFSPPAKEMERVLSAKRIRYPGKVDHTFRHMHQGRAYWLEAVEWEGKSWGANPVDEALAAGRSGLSPERRAEELGRQILPLLGELQGEVDGRTLRVSTRNVAVLDVWLGSGLVGKGPLTLMLGGKEVFQGEVKPSLELCLAEARRTYDFDRLRWGGVRIEKGGKARIRQADDRVPPLIPEG